ncbi:uncharacterized protein EKO05_0000976 [Ascochyta rabiei]|uniref:uncharacterized protein n=1 Tax=Didymella rabiei TaxID=5454 RepID=UPI0021FCFC16|nr:uncharacterized protein EKO05_0000976 [Ascochyta rabiei]UPX10309.1 hypothetical protein EKO05_0000976 [Ascochyta rabiei]
MPPAVGEDENRRPECTRTTNGITARSLVFARDVLSRNYNQSRFLSCRYSIDPAFPSVQGKETYGPMMCPVAAGLYANPAL